jgi:serine/threonine protein kinase
MPRKVATLWTDQRVDEIVTSAYVHSHLRASEQEVLNRPLYYGGDLTDNTYLDWILSRAKRLFLILVATGVPDQIFGVLDDCLDDDDLPIVEEVVPALRLSLEPDKALDKRFYRTQFRYLTRIVDEGEHIRYADEENVPLVPLGFKSVITSTSKDGVDTVKLPSDSAKLFIRRKVTLDSRTTEEQVLSEIAEMKKFTHEHVLSVYGSYVQSGIMSVLSFPAAEYTLKSFLTDSPKSFEVLSKTERRQILINWPHCLASALAFLHDNGGHHGAIRPSNIHINQQWHISLGQLDGDGVLCCSARSDDIEAYQYAPPERWKRAVTVQSTGSGKMALPSSGRTARKAQHEQQDALDPSSRKRSGSSSGTNLAALTAYAYLPASKSEFARFRLSTAVEPTALIPPRSRRLHHTPSRESNSTNSRSTARTPAERGGIGRAPSALSSTSSEDRKRNRSHPQGIFLAAPENRTAVVQTWKSVQHDSFAADVFSLGAVIMDILTVLCKKTYSSFARHRSAKNRNAGRGGGLADASFHANLGQVMSWVRTLADEAEKKAKKDESQVLRAIGAVLQLTVSCMERNPESRLKSSELEQKLGGLIKEFANIDTLHCTSTPVHQSKNVLSRQPPLEPSLLLSAPIRLGRSRSRTRQESIPEDEELPTTMSTSLSLGTRPTTSRTLVATASPPAISLRSLPSFNLDIDTRSEQSEQSGTVVGSTVVERSAPSRDHSVRNRNRGATRDIRERDIQAWAASDLTSPKPGRFEYTHTNDREVDPRLSLSMDNGEGGVFTYMNYSTSGSDEEDASTYMYPLPPQTRPPTRNLPPVPPKPPPNASKPLSPPQSHPNRPPRHLKSLPPANKRGPTEDEMRILRKLSEAMPGSRHPVRMSSLHPGHGGDDDGEEEFSYRKLKSVPRSASPPKVQGDRQWERVYRARARSGMAGLEK